jgi:hypothetical protein
MSEMIIKISFPGSHDHYILPPSDWKLSHATQQNMYTPPAPSGMRRKAMHNSIRFLTGPQQENHCLCQRFSSVLQSRQRDFLQMAGYPEIMLVPASPK